MRFFRFRDPLYVSRRKPKGPRKLYFSGHMAHLMCVVLERNRLARELKKNSSETVQERLEIAIPELDELVEWTDLLVAATMFGAGFHRPQRGPWRLRKPNRDTNNAAWSRENPSDDFNESEYETVQ